MVKTPQLWASAAAAPQRCAADADTDTDDVLQPGSESGMTRLLVAAFALQLFFAPAAAYSAGGGDSGVGQSCDALRVCAYGDLVGDGATRDGWAAHNGNCASAGCTERRCPSEMHLVGQPTRTDVYTVRTGDSADASADPKSYVHHAARADECRQGLRCWVRLRPSRCAAPFCGRQGRGRAQALGVVIECYRKGLHCRSPG